MSARRPSTVASAMPSDLASCFVDFGQVGGFDLLHGDHEVGLLAGHVLAVVVGRERQREGAAVAGLQAAHGVLEFLEHLAFADDELEVLGLAALEGLAVDLAFEVDRHAVAVLRGGVLRALREGAALLAQDVERLVDGVVAHLGAELLDFGAGQVVDLDVREHLEHRVESQLALGRLFLLGDAGLAGHAQLGLVGGLREGLADLVVHDLVVHRVAVALGHDVHRHLAGTEAVHLDGAGQLLEARIDFGLDGADGQGQRDLAFELLEGFNVHGHLGLPCEGSCAGARGRTRTGTPCWRQDLNLVRLPISPPARFQFSGDEYRRRPEAAFGHSGSA